MKDRVPLYPGRVKLTPVSGQENTYDMVRADEPTQEGDPLSKDTFLKDATAALFGLDATAVPDDAFNVLSRFHKGLGNEYVWSKTKIEDSEKYDIAVTEQFKHGTAGALYYSDSFHVEGNQFVLDNPQSATPSASLDNAIKGKYFYSSPSATEMRKMPEDAVITDGSPITVSYIFSYTNARIETGPVLYGYVNSPDPNAYPPAVSDGYTYTALGQLGAGLKMELLWENADPLSYFPGQTISMDLSDVSQIMVMFRWDNTSDRDYVSKQLVIPVGGKGRNQEYGNGGVRTITVSTTGVTISADSKSYTYDQPWYIYGIKGVTA